MPRRKRRKTARALGAALDQRTAFPTDKPTLRDRYAPLTLQQRQALMCWAESQH